MNNANHVGAPAAYVRLKQVIDGVDGVLVTIGALMLFTLMVLIVADVTARYFFNAPLQWSFEVISSYLMPGLFFLAVSHTLKAHGHVAVDIVHNYIAPRIRYRLEAIACAVAFPVFAICAWHAAGVTWRDFLSGASSSSGLALPTWSLSMFLPIGFGMLSLRLLLNAIGYALSLTRSEPVLPLPPISGTEGAE